jgi:two-component system chemotaxis response regulator CheB
MPKIRLLIIDDSVVIRRMLAGCFDGNPDIEVVGTAADGHIGLAKLTQLNPDVVTLDMEMPVMDGLQTLAALRKTHRTLPVIMFSTLTERGASATLDALSLGANDYVTKPANVGSVGIAIQRVQEELVPKIRALCGHLTAAAPVRAVGKIAEPRPVPSRAFASQIDILTIGVSTGGPNALAALMPGLVKKFPVPIVIVQHMPALFTRLLAERITTVSGLFAREGQPGALLRPGEVWVAPGGFHMEVERKAGRVYLRTHEDPPENSCRPAVDVLFRSVARVYGQRSLAIVLTGMGQDGLRGCEHIGEAGGRVLVQDEATSVVWGMPGAVAQAGLADKILPLSDMADEINRLVAVGFRRPANLDSPTS